MTHFTPDPFYPARPYHIVSYIFSPGWLTGLCEDDFGTEWGGVNLSENTGLGFITLSKCLELCRLLPGANACERNKQNECYIYYETNVVSANGDNQASCYIKP